MGKAIAVKLTPVVAHLRVYTEGGSYEQRSPYACIITVLYLTATTVYLGGAKGKLTKAIIRQIRVTLKAEGIEHMTFERRGVTVEVDL